MKRSNRVVRAGHGLLPNRGNFGKRNVANYVKHTDGDRKMPIKLLTRAFFLMYASFILAMVAPGDLEGQTSQELTIVAAIPGEFPPQYSFDSGGKPQGFAIDVLDGIASVAGLHVRYDVTKGWEEAQEALRTGAADVIPNMGITERRKEFADFTLPVETFPISIFVREDYPDIQTKNDLSGHKVAVVKLNVGYTLLKDQKDIELVMASDRQGALFMLLSGQADALVYPEPLIWLDARSVGVDEKIKIVGQPIEEIKRGIAVAKGKNDLLKKLDEATKSFVHSDEYQQIYSKWYGKSKPWLTPTRIGTIASLLIVSGFIILLFLRARLMQRVNKKMEQTLERQTIEIKDREKRYRDLYFSMNEGVCLHELVYGNSGEATNYRIVDVNPQFENLTGLKKSNVIGKFGSEAYGTDVPPYFDIYVNVAQTGASRAFESYFEPLDKHFRISVFSPEQDYFATIFQDVSEYKQAEAALRKSEEKWRHILLNTPQIGISLDSKGKIIFANQYFLGFTGWGKKEIVGQNWFDLFIPDQIREEMRTVFDAVMSQKHEHGYSTYENEILTRDGETRIVSWANVLTLNSQGHVVDVTCLGVDVTERRRSEEALRKSEERYRLIAQNTLDSIWAMDASFKFTFLSPSTEEMFGYSVEEWMSLDWEDVVHPDHIEGLHNVFDEFKEASNQKSITEETLMRRKDGVFIWIEYTATPLIDQNLTFSGVVGVSRDITDRKRNEEALRESETRFKALHNASFGGITIHDKGLILECNTGLAIITGYSYDELIGMDGLLLIAEHSRPEVMKNIQAGYEKPYEVYGLRKDGEEYPLRLEARNIPYKGKMVRVVEFRDISDIRFIQNELIEAKERAETANQAKSAFLANMSHELRTPLNGVMGMLQLIGTTSLDSEQTNYAQVAIKSCRRLTGLLGDILDLSRIEANKMEIGNEPFDLEDTIQAVENLFSPAANQEGLELTFSISTSTPKVLRGDSARLQQILNNLIGNALKFAKSGPITVNTSVLPISSRDKCRILFSVSDTGIGISDDMLDKLFEPFVQADVSYTRQYQGAGLGLSIVRHLLQLMNGTMSVESEEGVGSTFYVSIPFGVDKGQVKEASPVAGHASGSLEGKKVLLAEDDKTSALAVVRQIEKLKCNITVAEDGKNALEALRDNEFDLVLMDVQMPVMDGVEVTRRIRNGEVGKDKAGIPIIALTAYAMAGDKERFMKTGMDGYVVKPVEMRELQNEIKKVFDGG